MTRCETPRQASSLSARPSHRRRDPALQPSLGVSSLDCCLSPRGIGGPFGSLIPTTRPAPGSLRRVVITSAVR